MLQVQNLTITHKKDNHLLLSDASFVIGDGAKTVLIGEEGNGKSTLLQLIHDPSLVADYITYTGAIRKNGHITGYLAQEATEEALNSPVYALLPAEADHETLIDACRTVGTPLDTLYSDRLLRTYSGGEKVKIRLSLMLATAPDLLLLDEPSGDLDLSALTWLERFIRDCPLPVVFISHDETLIENCATSILHLEQTMRKTVPRCTFVRQTYAEYREAREGALRKNAQLVEKERAEFRQKMEKYRQILQKVEHQQNVISRGDPHGAALLKKKMHAVKSMGRRFEREEANQTKRIDTEDAILMRFAENISLPAGKTILSYHADSLAAPDGRILAGEIDLTVYGGEKVCLIGKNGAGKTTLLREIAAQLLRRTDIHTAYMPQNYSDNMDFTETPIAYLTPTLDGSREAYSRICTFLGSVKFTADEMQHPIADLSGGQKAKLYFMKMILSGADTLVLDEPTRNFSPLSQPVIREVLSGFGGTIIAVSHDRKCIDEVFDTVYALGEGGLWEI